MSLFAVVLVVLIAICLQWLPLDVARLWQVTGRRQYCSSTAPSLREYINCVVAASFPHGFLGDDLDRYALYQPTRQQQADFASLVALLVRDDDRIGCNVAIPHSLRGIYAFNAVRDGHDVFCALENRLVYDWRLGQQLFSKGWPALMVWRNATSVRRPLLHLSAPHLLFDRGAEHVAAHSFHRASAKTLLLWPRHRNASTATGACIVPSTSATRYGRTDPVHNDDNLFHTAMTALYSHERASRPHCFSNVNATHPLSPTAAACPLFVQMHGKSRQTCNDTTHFITHGSGNAEFYRDPSLPVHQIVRGLSLGNASWTPSHPGTNPHCSLKATQNIAGRVINGVELGKECTTAASDADNRGRFVHVEQTVPDAMTCLKCWDKMWDLALPPTH
ncbi:hypothetical protein RI367_003620 [Sorochytrium milnesiophthora]